MSFKPAPQIFTNTYLKTQSLFCDFYTSERTNKYLSTLLSVDFPNISASLSSLKSFSILAFDSRDPLLKNILLYLEDHYPKVPIKLYYCNEINTSYSDIGKAIHDITILPYPKNNFDIDFDFSTFAIPFSSSFFSKLSKYINSNLPNIIDSNGNTYISSAALVKLLRGFDDNQFTSLLDFLSALNPVINSRFSSLGSRLVKYIVKTDSPAYPIRLINFNNSNIAESAPLEAIKKETQKVIIYPNSSDANSIEYEIAEYKIEPHEFQPHMFTVFLNKGGGGNKLMNSISKSLSAYTIYAEDYLYDPCGIAICWGVLRNSKSIIDHAIQNGNHFLYVDHSYFSRGHGRSYRLCLNSFECNTLKDCPDDRRLKFDIPLKPWNKKGEKIIVCPPTEYFVEAHKVYGWLTETIAKIKLYSDREIVVRKKPSPGTSSISLEEQLESAHALVTHSSNVAVEAACLGTPVFTSTSSAASFVGLTDLAKIENPIYPDREMWLNNLTYNQFQFDEFKSQDFLDIFRFYHSLEDISL